MSIVSKKKHWEKKYAKSENRKLVYLKLKKKKVREETLKSGDHIKNACSLTVFWSQTKIDRFATDDLFEM